MASRESREETQHLPVMVDEVGFFLRPERGGWLIDATVGLGGHAEQLLLRGAALSLLGIDQDPAALDRARTRLQRFAERVVLVHGNFRNLSGIVEAARIAAPRGILFDLGFSSYQLQGSGRGFSFEREEPLDMRMNPNEGRTAAEIVNQRSESELFRMLKEYGEERYAGRIARAIVNRRDRRPITTTTDLVEAVKAAVPRGRWPKRTHVATRTFQALRILVNDELSSLMDALPAAAGLLSPGGRLAVISFHSLEDRIVKRAFRAFEAGGAWAELEPAPIVPTRDEVLGNPRSRSAKLRVLERFDVAA